MTKKKSGRLKKKAAAANQKCENNDDDSTALEVLESEIPDDAEESWAKSKARQLLYQDLVDNVVPREPDASMPTKEIFTSRPEYAATGYKLFSSRLSTLRKIVRKDLNRAEDDQAAFDNFRANNTIHTHTARGYPEWDGSEAQAQLKLDINAGLHEELEPSELWALRPEFDDFPLKVFRDHIYQEIRTAKYLHTLKVKGKSNMKLKSK